MYSAEAGVSNPYRYSTNVEEFHIILSKKRCFKPLQVFYKQFLSSGTRRFYQCFKPLQVFYKQGIFTLCVMLVPCFKPLQVFYKLDLDSAFSYFQKEFQTLIGILQTYRRGNVRHQEFLFQTLIGILQTRISSDSLLLG